MKATRTTRVVALGLLLASVPGCGATADGTDPLLDGDETGEVEEPLVTTPVNEGFELGWLFPPWLAWGAVGTSVLSARTGFFGENLNGSAWILRTIDTTGLSTVTLKYDRRTVGLDAGEYLYVEWLPPGKTAWVQLERTPSTSWATVAVPLPGAGAGPISIRFRTNADSVLERADLDNVVVSGDTTPPVACNDGVKNGTETAVDCGGTCGPCADGKACTQRGDCVSAVCSAGTCQAATCSDATRNGRESDADCGGTTCAKCAAGKMCLASTDCASNFCSSGFCATPAMTTPVLVVLLDFSDTSFSSFLANPEAGWSNLVFGSSKSQGNHYWNEVSGGKFQLSPARETGGTANDGVVAVKLATPKPTGTAQYVVQNQTWIHDALELAKAKVPFSTYDTNANGHIENKELSILFVLDIPWQNVSGAGAEANIPINHTLSGTSLVVDKFARTMWDYDSIGTNMHELGHHILDLDHFGGITEHGLMGLGAYAQDPVIGLLHDPANHYATRPTHLIGWNKFRAGFVTPTAITATTNGVKLYSPSSGMYNVVTIPVVDGTIYLENRTNEGYDQSIKWCGHAGGVFNTEVSQYVQPLNLPQIPVRRDSASFDAGEQSICDYYALAGHNATFSIGAYTIKNVSSPGQVMTLDIVKNAVTPAIQSYKYRYWVPDTARAGYQMRRNLTATSGTTTTIDMSTFQGGGSASSYFTINLDSYFNTGEVRSLNLDAGWSTTSSYLKIEKFPTTGGAGTVRGDAIVHLYFDPAAAYQSSATVKVVAGGFTSTLVLTNLPRFP